MILTKQQQDLLDGKKGETMAKVMKDTGHVWRRFSR
jgi:predicted aconitase